MGLSEKALRKANRELLALHQRCIKTHLTLIGVKVRPQKKFFALYDYYIDENNIREYFHRPIKLFVYALVADRLKEIRDYFPRRILKD